MVYKPPGPRLDEVGEDYRVNPPAVALSTVVRQSHTVVGHGLDASCDSHAAQIRRWQKRQ